MGKQFVDTRGYVCPEPMLMVKRIIDGLADGVVEVVADTAAARENVKRLAMSRGWKVEVKEQAGEFTLTLTKQAPSIER